MFLICCHICPVFPVWLVFSHSPVSSQAQLYPLVLWCFSKMGARVRGRQQSRFIFWAIACYTILSNLHSQIHIIVSFKTHEDSLLSDCSRELSVAVSNGSAQKQHRLIKKVWFLVLALILVDHVTFWASVFLFCKIGCASTCPSYLGGMMKTK